MVEFFQALADPDIPFLRYALLAGALASVSLGIIGSYVVTRRISYLGGAISHCVLSGIGLGLFLQTVCGWTWCHPMYGAVASALAAAVGIGLVSLYAHQREDTVIGALWAVGMAVGILLFAKTPGYTDPMSYLFGDILFISRRDLWAVAALDALVAGVGLAFYPKFQAVCFDQEFAELRGVRVTALLPAAALPDRLDRGAPGPRGGHRDGRRAADAAGRRGRLLRPPTLADDAPGDAPLRGADRRGAGRQLPL